MRYIADTNVISETARPRPSEDLSRWLESLDEHLLYTTDVNIAELRSGAAVTTDASRATMLIAWIEGVVQRFGQRIFRVDQESLVAWHTLLRQLQQSRLPDPPFDVLIAAIAMRQDCTIATRDVAPFVATGVRVFNPFTGERFNGA